MNFFVVTSPSIKLPTVVKRKAQRLNACSSEQRQAYRKVLRWCDASLSTFTDERKAAVAKDLLAKREALLALEQESLDFASQWGPVAVFYEYPTPPNAGQRHKGRRAALPYPDWARALNDQAFVKRATALPGEEE